MIMGDVWVESNTFARSPVVRHASWISSLHSCCLWFLAAQHASAARLSARVLLPSRARFRDCHGVGAAVRQLVGYSTDAIECGQQIVEARRASVDARELPRLVDRRVEVQSMFFS